MELKKNDTMQCGWEFSADVQLQVNTDQYRFLYEKFLASERIEGLVADFGYSGAVVVTSHRLGADGSGLWAWFTLKSVT